MQFNISILLALVMAAATVSAVPHYRGGGDSEFNYNQESTDVDVKNVAKNECAVTQTQNCCTSVKKGSDEHSEWSKRYEHFGGREDGDYLDCKAVAPESSGGCAAEASPFCCNVTGSKLSMRDCSPLSILAPVSGLMGGL